MTSNDTLKVRCNQNRLFGCGRLAELPATRFVVGVSRRRVMASGNCSCGLPLAVVRDDGPCEPAMMTIGPDGQWVGPHSPVV